MDSKKSGLVIKYNLHWKNCSKSSSKNRINIVGMCDLSTSTRNLEQFKSYLLKNSGAKGDDVKVSYIGDEDKEFPIETQNDFQTALDYFREIARSGSTITLKLDSVFYKNKSDNVKRFSSSDDSLRETESISEETSENIDDEPPKWFLKYMSKFKEDLIKEIARTVFVSKSIQNTKVQKTTSTNTAPDLLILKKPEIKVKNVPVEEHLSSHRQKIKAVRIKSRGDSINTEKQNKTEQKLDQKLVKLEKRTQKIKAKKAALQMKSSVSSNRSSKYYYHHFCPSDTFAAEIETLMGAAPVRQRETTLPRVLGGHIFEQEWEVINTGQLPWTAETELHYAWGSEAFRPVNYTYSCPYLQPGGKGKIKVQLKIPKKTGKYESYWYFHHVGRRFGQWLGCQVFVEPSPIKEKSLNALCESEKSLQNNQTENFSFDAVDFSKLNPKEKESSTNVPFTSMTSEVSKLIKKLKEIDSDAEIESKIDQKVEGNKETNSIVPDVNLNEEKEKEMDDLSEKIKDLKIFNSLGTVGYNSTSDSDNQSIVSESIASSCSQSSGDFVVLSKPEENANDSDQTCEIITEDTKNSFVLEIPSDESEVEEYIKINKLIIPLPYVRVKNLKETNTVDNIGENKIQPELFKKETVEKLIPGESEVKINTQNKESQKGEDSSDRVRVNFEGQTFDVSKKLLRPDYLAQIGEDSNKITNISVSDNDDLENLKHSQSIYVSASTTPDASLSFNLANKTCDLMSNPHKTTDESKRVFVFPQSCPGFEVVHNLSENNDNSAFSGPVQTCNFNQSAWLSHYNFTLPPCFGVANDFSSQPNLNQEHPAHFNNSYKDMCSRVDTAFQQAVKKSTDFVEDLVKKRASVNHSEIKISDGLSHYNFTLPPCFGVANDFSSQPNLNQEHPAHFNNSYKDMCSQVDTSFQQAVKQSTDFVEDLVRKRASVNPSEIKISDSNIEHRKLIRISADEKFPKPNELVANSLPEGFSCRSPVTGNFPNLDQIKIEHERSDKSSDQLLQPAANATHTANKIDINCDSVTSASLSNPTGTVTIKSENEKELVNKENGSSPVPLNLSVSSASENIVAGAVNVASSAFNTARSVFNMFNPEPGTWVNGRWVPKSLDSKREKNLKVLNEMGFLKRDYNASLLARFNDDMELTISELLNDNN